MDAITDLESVNAEIIIFTINSSNEGTFVADKLLSLPIKGSPRDITIVMESIDKSYYLRNMYVDWLQEVADNRYYYEFYMDSYDVIDYVRYKKPVQDNSGMIFNPIDGQWRFL